MMEDECVEALGRPISSLKVAELRDELSKRALVKTGNKKELIDRLRLAIQRQLQQDGAADLTIQSHSDLQNSGQDSHGEDEEETDGQSAIDYSSPEKPEPTKLSSQAQDLIQSVEIHVIPEASIPGESLLKEEDEEVLAPQRKQEDRQQDDDNEQKEQLDQQHQTQEAPERHNEEFGSRTESAGGDQEVSGSEQKIESGEKSVEEQNEKVKLKNQFHEQERQEELEKTTESGTHQDIQPEVNTESGALQSEDTTDSVPQQKERSSQELETIVPVPFTLKRGISDLKESSGSNKNERRRKWSGKSECSQNSDPTQGTSLSGGISSQKLQELIDIQQFTDSSRSNNKEPSGAESKLESKKSPEKNESAKKTDKPNDVKNEVVDGDEPQDKGENKADKALGGKDLEEDVKDPEPEREPTNGLSISHLVRPFTVPQLKEELTKFGPIVEDKFWTNKVKSKCCVMYQSVEAAQQTKETLHGQHWPASNPKALQIKYITEDEYNNLILSDEIKKNDSNNDKSVNGSTGKTNKSATKRPGEKNEFEEVNSGGLAKKRSAEKLINEVNTKSSQVNRDGDSSQPQELDDLFKKTESKPSLFWLPLTDNQAEIKQKERKETEVRERESARKPVSRRTSPPRRRSPARGISPRHRSPRRSPAKHRSPVNRRTPTRRRSPVRNSPILRRRSPIRNSPPLRKRSPMRNSPPQPRKRSPIRSSPPPRRRSPMRDSPPPRRRSPALLRRSPGPIRRSPGPMRRSPGPIRRSPGPARRFPGPARRSPGPIRRSPGPIRRSPGPIRRSPGPIRRSPGPIRRSPGPIRRSPGPIRRSPGPIRRSPGPTRRSPGPMRRSPGPIRRSPMLNRRSPPPLRGVSPMLRRSRSRSRSRSPLRRRSPARRRSPPPRHMSPGRGVNHANEPRRVDRFERMR